MTKVWIAALGVATIVSVSASVPIAPAQAQGGSCGGTLVDYVPSNVRGQKIGQLQLYYNSSNGNNCATFLHSGPTWGKRLDTFVAITLQPPYSGSVQDSGPYEYYAGPVRIDGRNRCVIASGSVRYNGSYATVTTQKHCG